MLMHVYYVFLYSFVLVCCLWLCCQTISVKGKLQRECRRCKSKNLSFMFTFQQPQNTHLQICTDEFFSDITEMFLSFWGFFSRHTRHKSCTSFAVCHSITDLFKYIRINQVTKTFFRWSLYQFLVQIGNLLYPVSCTNGRWIPAV